MHDASVFTTRRGARKQSGTPSDARGPSRRIRARRLSDSIENGLDAIEVTTQCHALQLGQAFLAQQYPGIVGGTRPDRPMPSSVSIATATPGRATDCPRRGVHYNLARGIVIEGRDAKIIKRFGEVADDLSTL